MDYGSLTYGGILALCGSVNLYYSSKKTNKKHQRIGKLLSAICFMFGGAYLMQGVM